MIYHHFRKLSIIEAMLKYIIMLVISLIIVVKGPDVNAGSILIFNKKDDK